MIHKRHISQNCLGNTFFALTGHMIRLLIGSSSIGHDVAGATGGPIASPNIRAGHSEVLDPHFFCRMSDCHLADTPHM